MTISDAIGNSDAIIKYFTKSQLEADICRIEGCRPNVIINLCKPSDELKINQSIMSVPMETQIIDLWN